MQAQHTTVILTHENADFDAIAALVATARLYPEAVAVLPRRVNRNVRHFLTLYGSDLPLHNAEDLADTIGRVLLVDTQAMVTLRGMVRGLKVQIIDHHPLSRELPPGWTYGGEPLASVTTLLVEQLIASGHELEQVEATLLLLGIYEDSGSLSYRATTSRDVRCVAWLLDQGARLDIADGFLHYPLTDDQRVLYECLVERHQSIELGGRTVIVAATPFPRYVNEVSVLAHKLRDLWEPAALFILVQFDDQVQLIARSTSDAIDVGQIAADMGGGGHNRASAALLRGVSLDEATARVYELLHAHAQPPTTVRHLMSVGARTLSPRTTVREAVELMIRYGHEGFPVVDEGRVVGVLSRRETDRALRLGLGNAAISMYMTKGAISVRPGDSIEVLQQTMTDYGVGQVPVVSSSGALLGIVTRTDLIDYLFAPQDETSDERERQSEIAGKLEQMVPPARLERLRQAAQVADEAGYALYIVGGFCRDLLLGRPNVDIDLVVEGDAIALARKLQAHAGGRIRSHTRFGTAKWILDDGEALDFVTARREFYLHPTALPEVERSSIKQDLHRRDFTINTLAIRLEGEHYGELLDFYGGEQDLRAGLIRVLHSLSFIEDPTRVLRAIRLEQRLRFQIEPRTLELIDNALGFLDRVSGDRIRHELYFLFQEPEPEAGLARLEELGVLTRIHPGLRCDGWLLRKAATLRRVLPQWYESSWRPELSEEDHDALHGLAAPADNAPHLYLALLTYRLVAGELDTLIARINLGRGDADMLHGIADLKGQLAELQTRDVRPSEVVRLLEEVSGPAILVAWVATDSARVRDHLRAYWESYRYVKPALTGDDLKEMGLRPGPIYREMLGALRDALLDGEIASVEKERELVKELIQSL